MKKFTLLISAYAFVSSPISLYGHCQMPCGVYHDEMVFDQIDQYVETMFKGLTVMKDSNFETPKERNEFIRWVMNKENMSNEVADTFLTYFMQQKIKPGEEDTPKRLESIHKMLFLLVQIKQNVDRQMIDTFLDEWEKFKLMFHVEGYECQIETLKAKKREQQQKKLEEENHTHDHDHDHDHDHVHGHFHVHPHTQNTVSQTNRR